MSVITLGSEVPDLLVILQAGAAQSFGITLTVEPADLVGVSAELAWDSVVYTAALADTTYTWSLAAAEVAEMPASARARLSLVNGAGARTVLARGRMEVRS